MKKILAVSLVAIMAAGAARADIASTIYVQKKISGLDVAEIMGENEVILSVSETDGKISATTGKITESHLDFDVATQSELDAEIGTYDAATKTGKGLKKQVGDIEEKLKSVATTEGLGKLTTQVEDNTKAIATYDEQGNLTGGLTKDIADIETNIGDLADLNTEERKLVPAINEVTGLVAAAQGTANSAMTAIGETKADGTKTGLVKDIADAAAAAEAAHDAADANELAIGAYNPETKEGYGLKKSVAVAADAAAAAQGTADDAMAAIGGTDAEGNKTGLVKDIADAAAAAAIAQDAAVAAQADADANATAIATYDEQGNLTGGLTKDVEDIEANLIFFNSTIDDVANLETEAKKLVPAINEVKGLAESAQGTADEALEDAEDALAAIGETKEDGTKTGLVKEIAAAQETADDAIAAIGGTDEQGNKTGLVAEIAAAQDAADAAQATADLKVNKSSLGIVEDAENPFVVPDWCKGNGVVCSFVVFDGVAGWQQVVDEDPDA